MRPAHLTDRRRILQGIIFHMEAFQFDELVEAESTEGLSLARVLPACPGEVLLQLVSGHLSGRRVLLGLDSRTG